MPADDEPLVALLVRAGGAVCALPLTVVAETMRPLPLEAITDGPSCVCGVSVVRGRPLPVLDLACLLGRQDAAGRPRRLVILRLGERHAGLLVEAVLGVRDLAGSAVAPLPPLLDHAQAVSGLGVRDGALLRVLEAARAVPPEAFAMGAEVAAS